MNKKLFCALLFFVASPVHGRISVVQRAGTLGMLLVRRMSTIPSGNVADQLRTQIAKLTNQVHVLAAQIKALQEPPVTLHTQQLKDRIECLEIQNEEQEAAIEYLEQQLMNTEANLEQQLENAMDDLQQHIIREKDRSEKLKKLARAEIYDRTGFRVERLEQHVEDLRARMLKIQK